MIWHILRYWISFVLPVFYKRIQGRNIKNIQLKGPVIIAMNHPNAFTDPILITHLSYPIKVKYLARGDAFKPGLVAWFLSTLGIVPIFRMQDGGREGLKKNDDAYQMVNRLLKKNCKIIVFAEGLCVQERRLRPLKKGVSRMIFGAYEYLGENNNLTVLPVGINYSQPDKFRSTAFYNVGDPIPVKDFIAEYRENPAKANNTFLQILAPKMKELITHIDNPQNDEAVYQVEILCKKDILKERDLTFRDLNNDFMVLKELTEKVNTVAKERPEILSEFKLKAKEYFDLLKKNNLRDWLISPRQKYKHQPLFLFLRSCLLLLGFPTYVVAFIANYLPYKLVQKLTSNIVKNKEFYSSFAIALGMILFFLNYFLWFIITYSFSDNLLSPIVICSVLISCSWISLYYNPFRKKTLGLFRIAKNKELYKELFEKRKELVSLINKF
ncbi:MAG: 1-acyl-sn-glycerol-3-phosphate acyltransferase [Bacteroidetes bacterium]|nr:1-acyl-sn-glycerol-3-phosphate acyltransferase [Bacteroidota bacterium]